MAKNEVFRYGDHLSLPVPAGTVSGDPVVVGTLPGVAQTDRPVTGANPTFGGGNPEGQASVWLDGVHKLRVDGAVTTVGQSVYYVGDGTTRNTTLTTTAAGNTLFGQALETKTATAAEISVRVARV